MSSRPALKIWEKLSVFLLSVVTITLLTTALTFKKSLEIKEAATVPTCTGIKAPSCLRRGQTYKVEVQGLSNATNVKFPTWDSGGGQDDLVWYEKSGNWYRNIFQDTHPNGHINTHVYMYNASHSEVFCGGVEIPLCSSPSAYKSVVISNGDLSYNGYTAGLSRQHDYAPSIMRDTDGKYKMWWCGVGTGSDAIVYAESSDGHNWTKQQVVLKTSGSYQGVHACDPSVVKVNGTYYLYYTSEHPTSPFVGVDAQIFLATSTNGKSWQYANGGRPVIALSNLEGSYGIGQSAVIYKNNKFLHFYTDTTNWKNKLYVAESSNGINFTKINGGNPILYDIGSADVKYIPSDNKYLIVTTGPYYPWKNSYYVLDSGFRVIVQGEFPGAFLKQPCNHNPGIMGDHVGNLLNKNAVWTYFGTGPWGNESDPCWNPTSWQLHRVTLNTSTLLSHNLPSPTPISTNTPTPTKKPSTTPTKKPTNTPIITSTPIPVPGDATGNGVVDIEDYKVWMNNYNTSTQGGSQNGDFNENGRVDGKDYIIWFNNYTK